MAKATGSTTMYVVGLIFSILVSLCLVIVSYKLNEQITEIESPIGQARTKLEGQVEAARNLNVEIQDVRKLLVGDERTEVNTDYWERTVLDQANKTVQLLVGPDYVRSEDWQQINDPLLKASWEKLNALKGKTKAYEDLNTLFLDTQQTSYAGIYDQLRAILHILPRLRYDRIRSREEVETTRQDKMRVVKDLKKDIDAQREQRDNIQQEKIDVEKNFDDVKKKLLSEKEKVQGELAVMQRDKRLEEAALLDRIKEKDKRLLDLTKKEKRSFAETSKPDGEVIHADVNLGYAWIDLGRRHHLPKNLRFQVYQFVKGGLQKIKGVIELRNMEDDMSLCAVLENQRVQDPITGQTVTVPDPQDPIVKGDLIRTPLFDPHEKKTFVFLGRDAQQGYYSADELERKLKEEFGAKIHKQVSEETDYVIILGDLSEDAALQAQQKLASEFGVVFLPEKELLEYLGR